MGIGPLEDIMASKSWRCLAKRFVHLFLTLAWFSDELVALFSLLQGVASTASYYNRTIELTWLMLFVVGSPDIFTVTSKKSQVSGRDANWR